MAPTPRRPPGASSSGSTVVSASSPLTGNPSSFLSPAGGHAQSPAVSAAAAYHNLLAGTQQLSSMWQAAAAVAAANAAAQHHHQQHQHKPADPPADQTFTQPNGTVHRADTSGTSSSSSTLPQSRKRPLQEEATSSTDLPPPAPPAVNLSPTASADIKAKRRTLTLDFSSKESAKKTLVQTPDIIKLFQLKTPELDKFLQQGFTTGTATVSTPTPTQYLFPKDVTSPQRQYAQGFIDALNALHALNNFTPPTNLQSPTSSSSHPQAARQPAVPADSTTGDASTPLGPPAGKGSPAAAAAALTSAPLVAPNSDKVIEVVSSIVSGSTGGTGVVCSSQSKLSPPTPQLFSPVCSTQAAPPQVAPQAILSTAVSMMHFGSQQANFSPLLASTATGQQTVGGPSSSTSVYGAAGIPSYGLPLKQEPWSDVSQSSSAGYGVLPSAVEYGAGPMRPTVLVPPMPQQQHPSCSMQGRDALRRQLSATGVGGTSTRCSSKMSDYNIAVTSTGDEMSNASAASTPLLNDPFSQSALIQPMDPQTQERAKLERKRERNRLAATRCRKRKLDLIDSLKEKVNEKLAEIQKFEAAEHNLRKHVEQLRQCVDSHRNAGCDVSLPMAVPPAAHGASSSTAAS